MAASPVRGYGHDTSCALLSGQRAELEALASSNMFVVPATSPTTGPRCNCPFGPAMAPLDCLEHAGSVGITGGARHARIRRERGPPRPCGQEAAGGARLV